MKQEFNAWGYCHGIKPTTFHLKRIPMWEKLWFKASLGPQHGKTTRKQQNSVSLNQLSAELKTHLAQKQMQVWLCLVSNAKVANRFTGDSKVQTRGCTPCQETRIILWYSCNQTPLLSLTQVCRCCPISLNSMSYFNDMLNFQWQFQPLTTCRMQVQLQTNRSTVEQHPSVAAWSLSGAGFKEPR